MNERKMPPLKAEYNPLNRRAAFIAAAVSVAALAIPAAQSIAKQEVEPADPEMAIQHHAQRLAAALCRKHGGLWQFSVHSADDASAFLFTRSRGDVTGTLQTF